LPASHLVTLIGTRSSSALSLPAPKLWALELSPIALASVISPMGGFMGGADDLSRWHASSSSTLLVITCSLLREWVSCRATDVFGSKLEREEPCGPLGRGPANGRAHGASLLSSPTSKWKGERRGGFPKCRPYDSHQPSSGLRCPPVGPIPLPLPTTRLGSGTGTGTTAPKTCDALYDAPCTFGYALDALYVDAAAVAMDATLPTLRIERPPVE